MFIKAISLHQWLGYPYSARIPFLFYFVSLQEYWGAHALLFKIHNTLQTQGTAEAWSRPIWQVTRERKQHMHIREADREYVYLKFFPSWWSLLLLEYMHPPPKYINFNFTFFNPLKAYVTLNMRKSVITGNLPCRENLLRNHDTADCGCSQH